MATTTADVRAILDDRADDEARRDGTATIEAEHLLLALTTLPGDPAAQLLLDAGLTHDVLRAALDREWEQSLAVAGITVDVPGLPAATSSRHRSAKLGESAKLVLKRATATAAGQGSHRVGTPHLLAGALDTHLGRVPRALELAGVDRWELRARATQLGRGRS